MDSFPAPAPPATNPAAIPRRRRYHTKSHNACSHCRRRRIRCSKTRPVCAGCARRDLACVYPAGSHRHGPPRALLPAIQMHSVFTTLLPPTDMPLFEHFRTTAYPHVPLANDRIWRTEIPRLVNAVRPLLFTSSRSLFSLLSLSRFCLRLPFCPCSLTDTYTYILNTATIPLLSPHHPRPRSIAYISHRTVFEYAGAFTCAPGAGCEGA